MTLSILDPTVKYATGKRPTGWRAMMTPHASSRGASATDMETKSVAIGSSPYTVPNTGMNAISRVATRARLILTGCSRSPNKLHMVAATITAIVPFGHAVTIQNAEATATTRAERIPVRAAATGSDQKPRPASSSAAVPWSKAAAAARRRTTASASGGSGEGGHVQGRAHRLRKRAVAGRGLGAFKIGGRARRLDRREVGEELPAFAGAVLPIDAPDGCGEAFGAAAQRLNQADE